VKNTFGELVGWLDPSVTHWHPNNAPLVDDELAKTIFYLHALWPARRYVQRDFTVASRPVLDGYSKRRSSVGRTSMTVCGDLSGASPPDDDWHTNSNKPLPISVSSSTIVVIWFIILS